MGSAPDVYGELKQQLKDTKAKVILPSDGEAYTQQLKRWSEHNILPASCIVLPTSSAEVSTTLKFVRTHSIPFVVKGGGHSTSGSSSIENGLVIDLGLMRTVTVDTEKKQLKVGGGCLWVDVDEEAAKHGLATVGGTVNHTGVGGLTLGGGYGYLSGKHGLTIDNLLSVEIVLASGEIATASASQNPDLFWAVRGAGQNFGVTTSFTFQAYDQSTPVYAGTMVFTPEKLPQIVAFVNAFHAKTDGNQAILMGFSCPPPANAPVILTQCFHNGTEEEGKAFYADLVAVGPVVNMLASIPYQQLNSLLNGAAGFDGRKMFGGGAFKCPLDVGFVQSVYDEFLGFITAKKDMTQSLLLWEVVPYGEVVKVANGDMAFANRGEYYNLATMLKWFDPSLDLEVRSFARSLLQNASKNAGIVSDEKKGVAVYGNYSNSDVPADEIYGSNAKKLEELKKKYDPDNLFDRGTRLVARQVVVAN